MASGPGDPPVVIVGAGLAGLACARILHAASRPIVILEASDRIGGRVRSDVVDGFVLDRGFQVLLTAYPEARAALDYDALQLRAFENGAVIQAEGGPCRISDPWRSPQHLVATLRAPIGSIADKARLAWLRHRVRAGSIESILAPPVTDTNAAEWLCELGFSAAMITSFLGPLFAGISLDPQLRASARMSAFVFRMLSVGDSALPARGMQAIPDQLASSLPAGTIRLKTRVQAIASDGRSVKTGGAGETVRSGAVVVATDASEAVALVGRSRIAADSRSATCVYYSTDEAPFSDKVLVLNGLGASNGPINNLCVPTNVAPSYGPADSHLISATILGPGSKPATRDANPELERAVRDQLRGWFGTAVAQWRHLRTYTITNALPRVPAMGSGPVELRPGVFLAGDHRETASIQGALLSGRKAAEAILA